MSDLIHRLSDLVPPDRITTDADRLQSYRSDQAAGVPAGLPLAVVFPVQTSEVAAVVAVCAELDVPIVPRGAGSGLSGGANAIDGCVVVCLERMDRILSVDPLDGVAVVQPGVVNDGLRAAVREYGLLYAPDPSSRDWCSIGGNVATNAGGLCCVKYGVTRDSILALEVVLADGRVTRVGHRSIKGVAGYDLVGLFVGSEGTLGIVTEITVRLRPLPAPALTVVGQLPDLAAAGAAIDAVLALGTPSLLELMDRASVRAVEAYRPMGLDTEAAALLIAQTDLPGVAGEEHAAAIAAAMTAAGATEVFAAETVEESEALLTARRIAFPAIEAIGEMLVDDVAVPRGRVTEMLGLIEKIAVDNDVLVATVGHVGDGNLHPNFVYDRDDDAARERAWVAFHQVIEAALALGGTVTGEHGVGLLKRGVLGDELDAPARDLHRAIKTALDPRGILNPGKSLPA